MKFLSSQPIRALAITGLVLGTGHAAAQTIVAGPLLNPTTGSRYYRIQGGTYAQLQAFARAMGGDLATIETDAENSFIASSFVSFTKPYIGLNDAVTEGTFAWSSGSDSTFRRWRAGEPDNSASRDYVRFATPGGEWEVVVNGISTDAIVEIDGDEPLRVPQEFANIPAAVAALPGLPTRTVLLGPGLFELSSSLTLSNVELVGASNTLTTVRTPESVTGIRLLSDTLLRDLAIEGSSTTQTMSVQGASNKVQRVRFLPRPGEQARAFIEMGPVTGTSLEVFSCEISHAVSALAVAGGEATILNSALFDLLTVVEGYSSTAKVSVINSTLARVDSAAVLTPSKLTITNSIVSGLTGPLQPWVQVSHSLLPQTRDGEGNIAGDPLFANAAANDFTLLPGSPAIDAASARLFLAARPEEYLDLAGNDRAVDAPQSTNAPASKPALDMGAFEHQPPAPVDTCKPDFNNDGFVDDTDFVTFAQFYDNFFCP